MRIALAERYKAQAPAPSLGVARPGPRQGLPGGQAGEGAASAPPLGLDLVGQGLVGAAQLMRALMLRGQPRADLPRLLRSHAMIDDRALAAVLATRCGTSLLVPDPAHAPSRSDPRLPDPRLIEALGVARCVALQCLPWRRAGAVTLVATTDPETMAANRAELEALLGPVAFALIAERDLYAALAASRRPALREAAQSSVPANESCRNWDGAKMSRLLAGALCLAAGLAVATPVAAAMALLALLLATLVLSTGLRLAAAIAALRGARDDAPPGATPGPLPVITVLVPLFNEPEIAGRLVRRLGVIDYPRDRLDVLLVVEEDDTVTRGALAEAVLPGWMRVIPVPGSPLRTKPRALNYALNFARGSLVGVYDAEDAPARDQLRAVAAAFARGPADLGCVQGVLDYYNPHSNWMTRCFTIEYAAWFRLVLTGFARLGLVVPLGGTTLFLRRDILERLGAWDAHNVTEDADLGVRLARHGYRTELIASVTQEEANGLVLPWIRQRSRWLKGYAMTYAVHMRDPGLLWRQLGAWRFLGLQVQLLGTLVQFLLAPIFWSLWLLALGLDLPPARQMPDWAGPGTLAILLSCEAVAITINLMALQLPRHRALRPWVLTLHAYFPLATIAAYKAAWEMLTRPFYWDKTTHGLDDWAHRPVSLLLPGEGERPGTTQALPVAAASFRT